MASPPAPPDPRTLAADLFESHGTAVCNWLLRRRSCTDEHLAYDATTRAILELAADFSLYDPARGSVRSLLRGMALRALRRLRRSQARDVERARKKAERGVTNEASAGREVVDELADREQVARAIARLASTPLQQALLELYLSDERGLDAWSSALGVADRPRAEREEVVRRELARLRQQLHRFRARAKEEEP